MPIYRFETSNAYTTIKADGYTINKHGVATFTTAGRTVATLREWQTIVEQSAIHTGADDEPEERPRPASGLPL